VFVNSPPTDALHQTYVISDPTLAGWDFHDTYFVTISAAKLASIGFNPAPWKVEPNLDQLHNSPPKPCPCPTSSVDPEPTLTAVTNADGTTSTITFTQSLAVNDNSYGTGNDPSWGTKVHTFGNLTGSDKAQFVITKPGQPQYNFTLDYVSAKTGAPSGYGSLGPTGGDGSISVGTVGPGGVISWTTSIDENMNKTPANGGCFGVGTWTVNSPTSPGKPECATWNFVDSYTVVVAGTFTQADVDAGLISVPLVHNSPAKPTTCPGGTKPPGTPKLAVTKYEVKDKQVKITISNTGNGDAFLTAINGLAWPQATNGNLMEIKLDGDSLWKAGRDGAPTAGVSSPASFTTAQLGNDQNHRKIGKNSSDQLILIFKNNAATDLKVGYAGTVSFQGVSPDLTILPQP